MNIKKIEYEPIGIIRSPFKTPEGTPVQPGGGEGIEAMVEIFPRYMEGLTDLDGFSHVILLYHCHLAGNYKLRIKPFLDNQNRGLFATRAPSRPNAIGLSTTRLLRIEENRLFVSDVDMLDGSPVLDIKPYIPRFDVRKVDKIGWLTGHAEKITDAKADDRFSRDES